MPRRYLTFVALLGLAFPSALRAEEPTELTPVSEASFSKEELADTASCDCNTECENDDCCGRHWYVSALTGVSFMNGQSGGFNTGGGGGGFDNTGSDDDDVFFAGGAIGLAIPREYGTLRIEVEGRGRNQFNGVTDSFLPPTPTFFYDVEMRHGWSTMVNAWFDVPVRDKLAVYGGGGIGAAGYTLSVDDLIVSGQGHVTEFAWQIGLGVIYQINDRIELDLGYRYTDLGTANIPLSELAGGAAAGNYTTAVTTQDILLQVRINEPLSFLRNL